MDCNCPPQLTVLESDGTPQQPVQHLGLAPGHLEIVTVKPLHNLPLLLLILVIFKDLMISIVTITIIITYYRTREVPKVFVVAALPLRGGDIPQPSSVINGVMPGIMNFDHISQLQGRALHDHYCHT